MGREGDVDVIDVLAWRAEMRGVQTEGLEANLIEIEFTRKV